jgi:hypothetical protein
MQGVGKGEVQHCHHYAIRDLGLVVSSGHSKTVEKSHQWVAWGPLLSWLVFHNSIWESGSVHSVNMLYLFVFVIVDFFQNWLSCEFFYDILIPFVVKQGVFCGFPHFRFYPCDSGFVLCF